MSMGLEQSVGAWLAHLWVRAWSRDCSPPRIHQLPVAHQAGTRFHEPPSGQWLTSDRPNWCRPSGSSSQCYCVIIVVQAMPAQKMAFCSPSYLPVLRVFPTPLSPCPLSVRRGDIDVLCRAELLSQPLFSAFEQTVTSPCIHCCSCVYECKCKHLEGSLGPC